MLFGDRLAGTCLHPSPQKAEAEQSQVHHPVRSEAGLGKQSPALSDGPELVECLPSMASEPQGSPRLCLQHWDYRHVLPHLALDLDAKDQNSGANACVLSVLPAMCYPSYHPSTLAAEESNHHTVHFVTLK